MSAPGSGPDQEAALHARPSPPRPGLAGCDAATLRGIIAMIASCALLVANDTLVKLASESLPAGQIMALRGLFALVVVAAAAPLLGGSKGLAAAARPLVLLRGILEACAAILFINALARLPLANATSIVQTVPLIVTVLSVLVLGARVGWRRSLAIAVGFLGTLLVVRPGLDGFGWPALLALGAAFAVAVRDIVTRRIGTDVSTLAITLATTLCVALVGGALAGIEHWTQPEPALLALLAAAALLMTGAHYLVIVALRGGEIAVVAPFRYTFIVWALISGFLVWGEVPDAVAALGIALIAFSGAYAVRREKVVERTGR